MAEIVGLTASIITLVEFTSTGIKFCKKVKDAPMECLNIKRELVFLQTYLQDLDHLLNGSRGTPEWIETTKKLAEPGVGMLSRLESTLGRMSAKVKKVMEGKKIMGMTVKYRAIVWPFTTSECRDVLNELERAKTLLSVAVQLDQARLMVAIQEDLSNIQAQLAALVSGVDDVRLEMERARGRSYLYHRVDMYPGRWDALFGQSIEGLWEDHFIYYWFYSEASSTPIQDAEDRYENFRSRCAAETPVAYTKINDVVFINSYSNVPRTLEIYMHVLRSSGAVPDWVTVTAVLAEEQRHIMRVGSKAQCLVREIYLEMLRECLSTTHCPDLEGLCFQLWKELDIPEVTLNHILFFTGMSDMVEAVEHVITADSETA